MKPSLSPAKKSPAVSSKNGHHSSKTPSDKASKHVFTREEVLRDYQIASESRHASYMGRREALSGNAKFGIFGDGKEVPQLILAKVF